MLASVSPRSTTWRLTTSAECSSTSDTASPNVRYAMNVQPSVARTGVPSTRKNVSSWCSCVSTPRNSTVLPHCSTHTGGRCSSELTRARLATAIVYVLTSTALGVPGVNGLSGTSAAWRLPSSVLLPDAVGAPS